MLTPGTVTEIKLKLKKLQKKWVKLETYQGLSHCRFDFDFVPGSFGTPIIYLVAESIHIYNILYAFKLRQ